MSETDDLTVEQDDDSPVIQKLRRALAAKTQEIRARDEQIGTLNTQVRDSVFRDAGVPDNARGAIEKLHPADGEWTADAIKETAAANGYPVDTWGDTPAPEGDPAAPVVDPAREAQARRRELQSGSAPLRGTEPSIDEKIAKAEQDGDWNAVISLGAQKAAQVGRHLDVAAASTA